MSGFRACQYLQASITLHKETADADVIRVSLNNYVLLSPNAIHLDEANRTALQGIMNEEPLALIEYWAVDPSTTETFFGRCGRTTEEIPKMMAMNSVSLRKRSSSRHPSKALAPFA